MKRQQSSKRTTQKNHDRARLLPPPIIQTSIISSATMDVLDTIDEPTPIQRIKEVETMELQGIIFYIDPQCNVYNTYDVLNKKKNPRVIGKFVVENNSIQYSYDLRSLSGK